MSVRYRPDRLLVTPRGLLKSELAPEDLVEVDLDGRHLGGSRMATTELDLHLRVYRRRPRLRRGGPCAPADGHGVRGGGRGHPRRTCCRKSRC